MKRYIKLILLISILGCRTYQGYQVKGRTNHCLDNNDLEFLINTQISPEIKASHLFIDAIVVNKFYCIGLYGYTFRNLTTTGWSTQKVLKFEGKIYKFNHNNTQENISAIEEFKTKYHKYFSETEINELSIRFLKGTESNIRYY